MYQTTNLKKLSIDERKWIHPNNLKNKAEIIKQLKAKMLAVPRTGNLSDYRNYYEGYYLKWKAEQRRSH